MNIMWSVMAAAPTGNPGDELKPGLDPSQVSPGLAGFLVTFVLVAAVVLLILDFNRRNRRLRYRAQYAEQRAAQEAAGDVTDPRTTGSAAGRTPGRDAAQEPDDTGSTSAPR